VQAPWYVAAGWAIDLFLGGKRRDHEDLEIAIPAAALPEFVDALDGFEIYAVRVPGKGIFTPLAEAGPGLAETHQTWVRDPDSGDWKLDLFREPSEGGTWICGRDESIRMPFAEAIWFTDDGIPYGRPELVLLFKARHAAQEKNQADFAATLPRLGPDERDRLSGLARARPPRPRVDRGAARLAIAGPGRCGPWASTSITSLPRSCRPRRARSRASARR
jgi:hypothetical protein